MWRCLPLNLSRRQTLPKTFSRTEKLNCSTVQCKVCNKSWEAQLTSLISWALTARNLVSKVVFSIIKGSDSPGTCVVFEKNEIYRPTSSIDKIITKLWFITKSKIDLHDLYC